MFNQNTKGINYERECLSDKLAKIITTDNFKILKLLWVIKQTLEKNDIEIVFPQRVLWFGNELQTRQLPSDSVKS